MEEAYNFVILDLVSSNALAYPDTLDEAERVFETMRASDPVRVQQVAIVGLDKDGSPVGTLSASEIGSSAASHAV
jgi:hypothetical protein